MFSLDDQYKQILKDIGNGLSLVSIQNLQSTDEQINQSNKCIGTLPKEDLSEQKSLVLQKQIVDPSPEIYQPNDQEQILFD